MNIDEQRGGLSIGIQGILRCGGLPSWPERAAGRYSAHVQVSHETQEVVAVPSLLHSLAYILHHTPSLRCGQWLLGCFIQSVHWWQAGCRWFQIHDIQNSSSQTPALRVHQIQNRDAHSQQRTAHVSAVSHAHWSFQSDAALTLLPLPCTRSARVGFTDTQHRSYLGVGRMVCIMVKLPAPILPPFFGKRTHLACRPGCRCCPPCSAPPSRCCRPPAGLH